MARSGVPRKSARFQRDPFGAALALPQSVRASTDAPKKPAVRPTCAACGEPLRRRSPRRGFVERALSAADLYPFRCLACGYRFLVFRPGADDRSGSPEVPWMLLAVIGVFIVMLGLSLLPLLHG